MILRVISQNAFCKSAVVKDSMFVKYVIVSIVEISASFLTLQQSNPKFAIISVLNNKWMVETRSTCKRDPRNVTVKSHLSVNCSINKDAKSTTGCPSRGVTIQFPFDGHSPSFWHLPHHPVIPVFSLSDIQWFYGPFIHSIIQWPEVWYYAEDLTCKGE